MTNLKRDAQAYKDFRGFDSAEIIEEHLPDHDVSGWHMGEVDGIAYTTFRDNETQHYYHEFKKKAAPSLVAAENGKKLYLTGGNYHVTDRGIEDKTMPALLIANPHKRGTKPKEVSMFKRSRKRSVSRARHVVKANPIRRTRRASSRGKSPSVVVVRANPVSPLRHRKRHVKRNPIVRTHARRRVRRNPITGGRGALNFKALILPAIMQGAGAVATSIAVGYLPIPANLKSGSMLGATKAVVGLGLGYLVAKIFDKRLGQNIAEGSLTIAAYDAINGVAHNAGIQMAAMYPHGMGAMYPGLGDMGWTTGASVSNDYASMYH